jgi:PAS domain S-box-containing protein
MAKSKPKILVVEDEWIIAHNIKTSLENLGYKVPAVVATGEEAIKKSEAKKPNLVLMDIVLQGEVDGIEAAKRIISKLDIPVIFLTAYTENEVLKQAKKTGAHGYLVKPFKDRELQAAIEFALYKHKVEKQLKDSENKLFTTLQSINDAVISTDDKGIVTFMNPVAQTLTGWKLKDARGKHLQDIFNIRNIEEESYSHDRINEIILKGTADTQINCILSDRHKREINIELSHAPIIDDKGKISGTVIVFRDITRRIQIERELERYRQHLEQIAIVRTAKLKLFSDIVEKSPDGVQIADQSGYIIYSNPAVEEIYGLSHEELKGKHISELTEDSEFANNVIIPSINKHGKWDGEIRVRDKNGKAFPIWLAAFMVNDSNGQPMGIIGIVRDLTERKLAEEALRESEEKYRLLFEKAPLGIFHFDKDGNVTDCNEKFAEIIGAPKEKIVNFNLMKSLKDKKMIEAVKVTLNGKFGYYEGDYLSVVGGKLTPVKADFGPILSKSGSVKGGIGVFEDITERKQAEEKLKKYHEQLEELVRERTRELVEANKHLQVEIGVRKKAEKQLIKYQKQLQSLTSQLSLIEENEKRRIATELHDCVGQTLALSKIKLGLLNKSVSTPEHKDIIREILQLIEQTIKETRTLTFELSPPILYELGLRQAVKWLIDQFREKHGLNITLEDNGVEKPFDNNTRFFLFQAVRELLVNVVKHAKANNVKITMRGDNSRLRITIEDDGVGFSSNANNYSGYGLFNIRERMNHINGTFEIKSIPGQGTTVILDAPFMAEKNLSSKELV